MVKWIVQNNLLSMVEVGDNGRMKQICDKYGFEFEGVKVIPFSWDVPEYDPNIPTIPYGGTGWINNIYNKYPEHKGIFFNPESIFTFWINKYKGNALNYGAVETNFEKLAQEKHDEDDLYFIRPVSDQKEFSGGVMNFGDIQQWKKKIFSASPDFGETPIIIGEPYTLSHEWRLFILNKKVITGSQYRTYFVRNTSPNVPEEVIEFANAQAEIYSPSDFFVMDVCRCGEKLYVIEIGCFNSAGFYDADLDKIMLEISQHVDKLHEISS